jgi:preprotein translocase subunit SecA
LRLQRRVQMIRYRQRLEMEKRDQWMDQTRKSLA